MTQSSNTATSYKTNELKNCYEFFEANLTEISDPESFSFNFIPMTLDESLFKNSLISAIKERRNTKFMDELCGIPIAATLENKRLNIYIDVKHVVYAYADKHQLGKVEVLSIDLSYYNRIAASRSAFGSNIAEYYFMNENNGYYSVIIFGY